MSVAPSLHAPTSHMAWWLAPESTTQGDGRSLARNSLASSESNPGSTTDPKRTQEGGPSLSMRDGPFGRGSNTSL
eukprot:13785837-Alexandrium_andersonii.AAC.1